MADTADPRNTSRTDVDVLIVGAGFGGVSTLLQMRELGLSAKIFESGSDIGGVWYWNRYSGARVDSNIPIYELPLPQIWRSWTWTERFPGYAELRSYFAHLDNQLDLKKDILFDTRVISASFDPNTDTWTIRTADGKEGRGRFLVLCTGLASKIYIPTMKGLDTFKGTYYHSAQWPKEEVDVKGKRVAVIGTGATGVQIIQELSGALDGRGTGGVRGAGEVEHLTVFQRTPNLCIPMQQRKFSPEEQQHRKDELYSDVFNTRLQTWGGYDFDFNPQSFATVVPEQRRLYFEELWKRGGFHFLISNYADALSNEEANNELYSFWRDKVRERLHSNRAKEILAPMGSPHPIGAKRSSLEQAYYEVYNKPNVSLISLSENPISEITEEGIMTADGMIHEVDIIIFATGFDGITGGITQIDIRGVDGSSIADKWKEGVHTYLGDDDSQLSQHVLLAPTALSNGPTCIEIQAEWIKNCLSYMRSKSYSRIETSHSAEVDWRNLVLHIDNLTLMSKTRSWWNGANIPGKPVEQLNFAGGIPLYGKLCKEKAEKEYEGFTFKEKVEHGQYAVM
ncbi:hypothetical protein VNI00_003556 [Paramarasmius palmivorus]|uniref:FAD/NAD(P)-binding domain-containing protein n=1 Tax=Paramarasmius palmivorus TaxID=297713 RepID=A0AAW0DPQ8_9AGAR